MAFTAFAIANEFLAIAGKDNSQLSPMKIQKLVFYAHGWCLALTEHPLISERFEAWDWGPVVPKLYGVLKVYGNEPVDKPISYIANQGLKFHTVVPSLDNSGAPEALKEEAREILAGAWRTYGKYSSAKLSNATHAEGTPWAMVYRSGERSVEIPNKIIENYFKQMVVQQ
jgi:uncharacterized phage-associated protein